jgi:hypothetical protein
VANASGLNTPRANLVSALIATLSNLNQSSCEFEASTVNPPRRNSCAAVPNAPTRASPGSIAFVTTTRLFHSDSPGCVGPFGEHGVWVFAPIGERPDWLASYRVVEQAGELIVAELRVVPAPHSEREMRWLLHDYRPPDPAPYLAEPVVPGEGLSTRLARAAVRIGEALTLARHEGLVDVESRRRYGGKRRPLFSDEALAKPPRSVGRRGRPDGYYAELAAAYIAAIKANSRRPVADVAEQLGEVTALRTCGTHFIVPASAGFLPAQLAAARAGN